MTTLLLLAAVLCPGEVDVVTAPDACSVVRFDRINGGAAPDYIVIVLGGNGVFAPFVFGVDPIGGYYTGPEEGNALHANPTGGRQMGDGLFAWLANDLDTRAAR